MPLKKSGIHMGNTTASLSSFLASSRSAMSSLQFTQRSQSVRKEKRAPVGKKCEGGCEGSVYGGIPVYVWVTGHDVSLQRVHQVTVIPLAIKLLLLYIPCCISSSFLSLIRKKDGQVDSFLYNSIHPLHQPPIINCSLTFSSLAFVPRASLNPGRSGLELTRPRPPGTGPR